MSTPMVTYKANCHCGHVRFSFPHPLLQTSKVVQCNCSICTKNGYLLVYPRAADVVFASGQNDLSAYRFGNKAKPHKFCPYCGTSLLIDFSDSPSEAERVYLGINIRAIEGIEELIPTLEYRVVDGKNKLGPPYSI